MAHPPEAFFRAAPGRSGQRLYLYHEPQLTDGGAARGAVLYVHPFAEEMNKSRRMAALLSRALAGAGYAVLQIDLSGCGDSSGDFGDATWDEWLADTVDAATWLRDRCAAPLWIWGLRAGCLLATATAGRLATPSNLLLWQPMTSGKVALQQFLRLKAAAQLADGGGKGIVGRLRADLAAGQKVHVAGYSLHPGLAGGLEAATLSPPSHPEHPAPGPRQRLVWLEVSTQAAAALSPAGAEASTSWRHCGFDVDAVVVQGPPFWQTTEIEDAPRLVEASVSCLLRQSGLA